MEKPAVGTESKTEEAAAKVEEAASAVGEAVKEKTTEMTEAVKEAVEGGIGSDGAQLFQSHQIGGKESLRIKTNFRKPIYSRK